MIKVLLVDFARVLLFPNDEKFSGKLNDLYKDLREKKDFKFEEYFYFNEELLEYLKTVKNKFRLAMFTSEIIQKDSVVEKKLEGVFERIYSAQDLGFRKNEAEVYRLIAKNLSCGLEEILFIDDWEENINCAKAIGINTFLYKDINNLIVYLEKI